MSKNFIIDILLGFLFALAIVIARYATLASANSFVYQGF